MPPLRRLLLNSEGVRQLPDSESLERVRDRAEVELATATTEVELEAKPRDSGPGITIIS